MEGGPAPRVVWWMCLVEMATRVALAVRTSQSSLPCEEGEARRQQRSRERVFMALAASAVGLAVVSENTSRDENKNEKGK